MARDRPLVRGDTLAVLGERDDTPVISGFLMTRKR
jgi:hypothetical protein